MSTSILFARFAARSHPSVGWLRAPPTPPPACSRTTTPSCGWCSGWPRCFAPATSAGVTSLAPQASAFGRQLLLPAALLTIPRRWIWTFNPTVAAAPPRFVPPPLGGQAPAPSCWSMVRQCGQGRPQNAGVKSLHQETRCNAQGVLHHRPLLASRRLYWYQGARGVCLAVPVAPHPRGRGLEPPATLTHLAG